VQRWYQEADSQLRPYYVYIATQAARWGWDQRGTANEAELQEARDEELEACCEEMKSLPRPFGIPFGKMAANALRAARRLKPPSLKAQALGALGRFNSNAHTRADEMTKDFDLLRRALEALDD
jgi:hypothetical protein